MNTLNIKLPTGLRAAKLGMERADKSLPFRIGAALIRGSNIIIAWNQKARTSPVALTLFPYPEMASHAEYCLISRSLLEEVPLGGTCFVYREHADGSLAMARPCVSCFNMLTGLGVRSIIYTTNSHWEKEKL